MKHATGRPAALARCITSCNSSGAKRISFVEVRRSRVARFPFEPELRNGEPPEDGIDRGGISELGRGSLQRKYLPIVGGVLFLARRVTAGWSLRKCGASFSRSWPQLAIGKP
jgi:hypothetical protein